MQVLNTLQVLRGAINYIKFLREQLESENDENNNVKDNNNTVPTVTPANNLFMQSNDLTIKLIDHHLSTLTVYSNNSQRIS